MKFEEVHRETRDFVEAALRQPPETLAEPWLVMASRQIKVAFHAIDKLVEPHDHAREVEDLKALCRRLVWYMFRAIRGQNTFLLTSSSHAPWSLCEIGWRLIATCREIASAVSEQVRPHQEVVDAAAREAAARVPPLDMTVGETFPQSEAGFSVSDAVKKIVKWGDQVGEYAFFNVYDPEYCEDREYLFLMRGDDTCYFREEAERAARRSAATKIVKLSADLHAQMQEKLEEVEFYLQLVERSTCGDDSRIVEIVTNLKSYQVDFAAWLS